MALYLVLEVARLKQKHPEEVEASKLSIKRGHFDVSHNIWTVHHI